MKKTRSEPIIIAHI